jgi:hypothetical protein
MRKTLITALLLHGILLSAQEKNDTVKTQKVEEVVLVGRKPTIENRADRTIFNVSNSSILAGNTTWDE